MTGAAVLREVLAEATALAEGLPDAYDARLAQLRAESRLRRRISAIDGRDLVGLDLVDDLHAEIGRSLTGRPHTVGLVAQDLAELIDRDLAEDLVMLGELSRAQVAEHAASDVARVRRETERTCERLGWGDIEWDPAPSPVLECA